jgi:hypothetical protein
MGPPRSQGQRRQRDVFSVRAPTRDSHAARVPASSTLAGEDERLVLWRWRQRCTERKRDRLLSARKRRMLARWLRRTANRAVDPHPVSRRRELLLCDRVAAVRGELLEIAALLEQRTQTPGLLPSCISDGCESPLCNPAVHVSELQATLYYLRSALAARALSTDARSDSPPAEPTAPQLRSTPDAAMSAHRSCKSSADADLASQRDAPPAGGTDNRASGRARPQVDQRLTQTGGDVMPGKARKSWHALHPIGRDQQLPKKDRYGL